MGKVITVANQKGGIGKTTTALALSAGLRRVGKSVLLVDLDPQANASDTYAAEIAGVGTAYDLLVNGDPDCIQTTAMGDIIAGDPQLTEATKLLDGVSASYKLRKGLKGIVGRYDYIIVDTPPNLGVLLTNALTAADLVIIPLTSDRYSLGGLVQLHQTISDIKEYTNPGLTVGGFLLVKYRDTTLARAVDDSLPKYAEMFGTKIYNSKIRECIDARKAQAAQVGLYAYAPNSTTAQDYAAFVDEILKEGV